MSNKHKVARTLNLAEVLQTRSCFLFGPRQTGKSHLVRETLKDARVYNLLDSEVYLKLARNPKLIAQECVADPSKVVVIDEVQRLPDLLNEVHLLIEEHGLRFLLTGSSARKLRRGGVNLLGGRAGQRFLHPLTSNELGAQFDIERALFSGLLPTIYFSEEVESDLRAYSGLYLQEEIAAEGIARNVPAFGRFLTVAALSSGKLLNYSNIASDTQVGRGTVQEYFQILRDTFIGYDLPAWKKSEKRKAIGTSKFYLFDCGVTRSLQGRAAAAPGTAEYGEALEQLVFHELKSFCDYCNVDQLAFWRSTSGYEVDFILGGEIAIEVKSTKNVTERDLKGLRALQEEGGVRKYLCVSLDSHPRVISGIEVLPLRIFLSRLWAREL